MAEYNIKNYELTDMERQGLPMTKFDKKLHTQYKKQENPQVKPEKIFEGFVKIKKKKIKL